jgi:hypothetical protein
MHGVTMEKKTQTHTHTHTHSYAGRTVYRFVIKNKLRKLEHICGSEFARIVVFDVNGCRLLVKYVAVCVGVVLTFINDNTESQAAYKQCTKGFGIAYSV